MQSDFTLRLDQILGPRQIFHVMECHHCGYDEFYFQHPQTKRQIGIVCEGCNYIFTFENEVHELKISKEAQSSSPEVKRLEGLNAFPRQVIYFKKRRYS